MSRWRAPRVQDQLDGQILKALQENDHEKPRSVIGRAKRCRTGRAVAGCKNRHSNLGHDRGSARKTQRDRLTGPGHDRERLREGCGSQARGPILIRYNALRPAHPKRAVRTPARRRDGLLFGPTPNRWMRKRPPMHRLHLRRGRRWSSPALFGLMILVGATGLARADLPTVPDGFTIRLVAAVPAVQYPCQVATAPDGSLFVGEDPMDQVGPADKPIDRILLFRDGKEPVVFADKLNAIFGMVWHDGALYVMNMPHLTVFRDRDGDGKAERAQGAVHRPGRSRRLSQRFQRPHRLGTQDRYRPASLYLGR